MQERPPDLERRDVERERGDVTEDLVGREARVVLAEEQPHDPAMGHRDALRPPGGARRVHHVGHVIGADVDDRGRRRPGQRAVGVEHDRGRRRVGQRHAQPIDRHHGGDVGVLEHEGKEVSRIGGAERHVGRAGLQHAEQGHHHLERALHEDADPHAGPRAEREESLSEVVGVAIELRVGQPPVVGHQGHRVRPAGHVGLEDPVNRHLGIRAAPRAPLEEPRALHLVDQRQRGQPLLRIGHEGLERASIVLDEPPDRGRVEESGLVDAAADHVRAVIGELEIEVELRRAGIDVEVAELPARGQGRPRRLQREDELEERVASRVARKLERVHHLLNGRLVVSEGVEGRVAHAVQQLADGRIAGRDDAERQRVGEESEESLDFGPLPPGRHRAERQVVEPGVAVDDRGEGGEERHEQRDAFLGAQDFEAVAERRRQREGLTRAAEALARRPRPVAG